MSDEELEKLVAEMKNLKPSQTARRRGMDAAMAAFDTEFAAEKISVAQGLEAEARPTLQSTDITSAPSFGSRVMSKLRPIFTFNPKTAMMAGSCMAALIAAIVIVPQMDDFVQPAPVVTEAPTEAAKSSETDSVAHVPSVDAVETTADAAAPVGADDVTIETKPSAQVESKAPVEQAVPQVTEPEEIVVTGRRVESDSSVTIEIPVTSADEIAIQQGATSDIVTTAPSVPQQAQPNASSGQFQSGFSVNQAVTLIQPEMQTSETLNRTREQGVSAQRRELKGGITSVQDVLTRIRTDRVDIETAQREREQRFRDRKVERERLFNEARLQLGLGPVDISNYTPEQAREEYLSLQKQIDAVKLDKSVDTGRVTFALKTKPEGIARDQFPNFASNPVTPVIAEPVSTFSIDVDTASYSFLRASVNAGWLPPAGAVRLEEMINYFSYDYEAPTSADEPFKANVTVTPTPWNKDTKLMHIGIKGYVPPQTEKPRSNLVFLIDTSGSMRAANKLPLLKSSFKLLLNTLDEDDTVSIVTYAGSASVVLEPTPASETGKIKAALDNLRSGGSTAGAAGLELAYNKAQESFDDEGVNRVILATDGDFNVGFSSPDEMTRFIAKKRETGIFLSVLGFGQGNYNDALMQSVAQNGNGVAAYIDTLSEANKVLADEAGSNLITIAKDVKIQVEFNLDTISEYRLIGYETRALQTQDFNNDKVDAGEIGAGHSVTAIYELTPTGSPAQLVDDLRYSDRIQTTSSGSDEYAFVKIRHKLPDVDTSTLQTFPVSESQERSLRRASDDMRFAAAVAAVGQKLRGDMQVADYSYADVIKLAEKAKGEDEHGYRAEFIQLVRLIDNLDD